MGTEIERKYLVKRYPKDEDLKFKCWLSQGYLCHEPKEIRIRSERNTVSEIFFLTIKSKGDLVREETEAPISRLLFDKLWFYTFFLHTANIYSSILHLKCKI